MNIIQVIYILVTLKENAKIDLVMRSVLNG